MNLLFAITYIDRVCTYGYIVERFGSYNAPFVPMATLLFVGAFLWFRIDAATELIVESPVAAVPVAAWA